jgi:hypothetical protein
VLRPADRAWITLGAGVVAWDMACPRGEMLSEASARYAKSHPILAYAVIGSVAAHLTARIPKRFDLIHGVGAVLRAWKR